MSDDRSASEACNPRDDRDLMRSFWDEALARLEAYIDSAVSLDGAAAEAHRGSGSASGEKRPSPCKRFTDAEG